MPEKLWYLGTIVIFAGTAIVIELILGWSALKDKWKVIFGLTLLATIAAVLERFALHSHAWGYNLSHTLNVRIGGAELETYLFSGATAIAVAIATILLAEREDKNEPFPSPKDIILHLNGRIAELLKRAK